MDVVIPVFNLYDLQLVTQMDGGGAVLVSPPPSTTV